MPAANLAFDTILSTTMNKYRARLEDNIFRANPLMYWLQETNRVDKQDGGASLVVPIIAVNPAVSTSYTDYDAFTTQITGAQAAQLDAANYAWRQFAGVVAISGIEEAKNNGVAQVIKLLDAKVQLTELSMAEALDQMFFLNGTGNTGKDWFGLAAIVSDANAGATAGGNSSGFIGGIDRTAAPGTTMWKSYVEATAETLTLARMTTGYNTVSKGNDHPDLGLTTQTLFEKYEGLLQPQARYTDMTHGRRRLPEPALQGHGPDVRPLLPVGDHVLPQQQVPEAARPHPDLVPQHPLDQAPRHGRPLHAGALLRQHDREQRGPPGQADGQDRLRRREV